jgi:hypothetical protein
VGAKLLLYGWKLAGGSIPPLAKLKF